MGNRKKEILIVALHLFARDGYEAVSVSQIAGELDMPQEDKAARFYSVMFFYYSIYDGASAQK